MKLPRSVRRLARRIVFSNGAEKNVSDCYDNIPHHVAKARMEEYYEMVKGISPLTGLQVGKEQALDDMCQKYPHGIFEQHEAPILYKPWVAPWEDKS